MKQLLCMLFISSGNVFFFLLAVKEIGDDVAVYKITQAALTTSNFWSCCDHVDTMNSNIRVCSANVGATALKKLNVGYIVEGSRQGQQGRTNCWLLFHILLRPFVIELPNTFSCRRAIKPPWHWSIYDGITAPLSHAQKHQVRSQRIDKSIEVPRNMLSCRVPGLTSSEQWRKKQK